MKRPSLQFYPADWRGNANLRRSSFHDRGVWLEVMCLLHDSDEYGVVRWPLDELANATGCRVKDLQSLVAKGVLKGADVGQTCPAYIHTPRHAGKDGTPVVLIPEQVGPVWYSSRMVLDEWNRSQRGGATRFTADTQPTRSPTARLGEIPTGTPDHRLGDGATTTSSSSTSKESTTLSGRPDVRAEAVEILNFLNAKTGRSYKPVSANLNMILARLKDFPADDVRAVIATKVREWGTDEKMALFLRPKTLFAASNFANYEGQLGKVE